MAKNEIKHYGVLGMRWGRRRGGGGSSHTVGKGPLGAAKEVAGLAVDAIRDDVNKVRSARTAGINARKAVTGAAVGLGKNLIKGNIQTAKLAGGLAVSAVQKGVAARKATTKKLGEIASNLGKKFGQRMKDNFHKFQIEDSTFTAAALRAQASELKKSSNPKDHKTASLLEKDAKWIEDDLNATFTPEEIKKYLGQ